MDRSAICAFSAPYAPPDEDLAAVFLTAEPRDAHTERTIDRLARGLVEAVRAKTGTLGGIEDLLHEYALSTKEGLAIMVLAEALLRIPDAATADRLIEEKLAAGDWAHHGPRSSTLFVSASAWALGLTARIVQPGETAPAIVADLIRRLGLPAVRAATRQAMRLLGSHFVLGETIAAALDRAQTSPERLYSFDMLGEAARTERDAVRYLDAYTEAIRTVGARADMRPGGARAGVSVKLSALHPRYEAVSRRRVLEELVPRLLALARLAKEHDLELTVDAEEADRLELSLEVIAAVLADRSLAGWDGFGFALQAYQKRAPAVIDWAAAAAESLGRTLRLRLVKGAYWDTEIKRAQERGLADYPVFTRKAMTDLCYERCAARLLAARPRLFPQFATHNALTVATVVAQAGGVSGFEFQRLHGMGEALYGALRAQYPQAACRVYAPVGRHRDLLAYLVRRLLENGANSSFVSAVADPNVPIEAILRRPRAAVGAPAQARHPHIPRPPDLYRPQRRNAPGIELGERAALEALLAEIAKAGEKPARAAPLIDGGEREGRRRPVFSPSDGTPVGEVAEADAATAEAAMAAALRGFPAWSQTPLEHRAAAIERAADALEAGRGRFLALLQREGGKTLDDAVAEWREAIDFCRYYATEARTVLAPRILPGPTGESNELGFRGRGPFVCIAPWNFPLAIFLGQSVAALLAGNSVVAKPAEQTPLVAAEAIRLLHGAGVPQAALHLVPGNGTVGAALVADPRTAGVAFTGSTEVGRAIHRALAAKEGPIVPLIAETGGINALIVDSTALPEQVTDDVLASAFRSAGQRCSALRLLCLQEEIAAPVLDMIEGAAATLAIGDPRDPATHIGPVIDADAKAKLDAWLARMEAEGRVRFRWDRARPLPPRGTYVAPAVVAIEGPGDLTQEIFGPILHVVRWRAEALDFLLDAIAGNGYGLTLGIHSRLETTVARIVRRLPHGNVYVNRSTIGAVVGSQPFGGTGLSGTGPKSGGPHYLVRFAAEQVVSVNTAAVGGNASLFAEPDA
ncbi:MAG TPA: bifunctional proline dehydrogenase/L-glutamate gamma-semialdehyde dehydrogenase PutA [Xanthobacteraceae bacterium]|nr:bifunctional proline dehydrogenase/L-glutamate gamma-semialdehyde dehydrogenase PutA [Xanthobacteraceae bacterium]